MRLWNTALVYVVNQNDWKSDPGKQFFEICSIQLGKEATVKTAANLVKELAYQNKVSLFLYQKKGFDH